MSLNLGFTHLLTAGNPDPAAGVPVERAVPGPAAGAVAGGLLQVP